MYTIGKLGHDVFSHLTVSFKGVSGKCLRAWTEKPVYPLFLLLLLAWLSTAGAALVSNGFTNVALVLSSRDILGHPTRSIDARKYFDLAITWDSRNASAYRGLGLECFWLSEYASAESYLTESLVLNPRSPMTRFWMGKTYEQQGTKDRAVDEWRKANVGAIYFVEQAESKRVMGNLDEALYLFDLAVRVDPKSSSAHYGVARVYQQQGFPDKALPEYRTAIVINSGWSGALQAIQARYLIGGILVDRNRGEEAMNEFTQALQLIGNACSSTHEACILDANIHSALGAIYQRQSQWEKAWSEFKQATELNPGQGYLYVQLGRNVYYATRDLATAREQFQAAIEASPSDVEVWMAIANFYREAGLHDEALSVLNRVPEAMKTGSRLTFIRGRIHYELGRYQDTIEILQGVVKTSSSAEVHDIYSLLGSAYFNLGNYHDAERSLQNALAANALPNASVHALLGAIYFRTGRLDKAEQESRIAIGIAPAFAWAYVTLGDVFWEKGQTEIAKGYYGQAVRFGSEQIPSDELGRLMLRTSN